MICCTYYSGREPQCPVIFDYRNRLSCIEWGFPAATYMVMVSCTLVACSSNLSHSAAIWGSLCLMAQLCIEHIDRTSQQVIVDENQLVYSCMLTCVKCSEHLAQVSRPLTILTADSACPLLLGFLGEDVLCLMFQSL